MQEFAGQSKLIDMKEFKSCIDNQMSLGLVLKDMDLAASHQVNGTPTLFINGRRVQGVKDASELARLIDEASTEAGKSVAAKAAISAPESHVDPTR